MKHMQDTLHQCLRPGLSGFQPSQNSNAGGVEHCSPGSLGQRHRPGSYGAISMWVSVVMGVPQWLDTLEWNILVKMDDVGVPHIYQCVSCCSPS